MILYTSKCNIYISFEKISKRLNRSFGIIIRYCSNFITIYRIKPVLLLKIFSLVPDDFLYLYIYTHEKTSGTGRIF